MPKTGKSAITLDEQLGAVQHEIEVLKNSFQDPDGRIDDFDIQLQIDRLQAVATTLKYCSPGIPSDRPVLPCRAPCTKCGSNDVVRRFRAHGETWRADDYGKGATEFSSADGYRITAHGDHIEHHCRCCGYKWATRPMQKKGK